MSAHAATRAARSAAILGAMKVGDRVPFCVESDELRIGAAPEHLSADALVGMLWLQDDGRVVLLVGDHEQRLLFTVAIWLRTWLPVYPELAPLQYAITTSRQVA